MLVADREVGLLLSGTRRRARARRRRHGDRLRRQLRARRRAGARRWRPRRGGDRAPRRSPSPPRSASTPTRNIVIETLEAVDADRCARRRDPEFAKDDLRNGRTRLTTFSPREIVSELDRYIVGQHDAKRAVAIALRNRWRRQQLAGTAARGGGAEEHPDDRADRLRQDRDLAPPRAARRRAVPQGRGHQVHRGRLCRPRRGADRARPRRGRHRPGARTSAASRCRRRRISRPRSACSTRWSAPTASAATRESFRRKLQRRTSSTTRRSRSRSRPAGGGLPMFEIPGMPGASVGAINLVATCSARRSAAAPKTRRTTVQEAYEPLVAEESDKLLDQDASSRRRSGRSRTTASSSSTRSTRSAAARAARGADVSREGVQRDLLPLIEGTTVATKHGPVKTDHILFIASGAFHVSKPSDLLPELQGRLPIRVELRPLTVDDFRRILTETEASLIKQYGGADGDRGRRRSTSPTTPSTRSPRSPST